ncbi:abhd11 [Trichonephila clavata]|uniref:sn-1-specific diacylglycerol lipase ABHD11 n=1 Tax=Trichonephila clavata TaxID=2740835 RepID=A0A8X6LZP9_TRICU|nr:abhd11 [Trichonephila clavata]
MCFRVVPVELHFTTVTPSTWKAFKKKSPIIFIHGLLDSGNSWNRVKNKICQDTGRKGYIITLRNHGRSTWSEEITTEHFIADLENFMADQNISRAVMVAHSIGAKPAMQLALRKEVPGEDSKPKPMAFTLPIYKDIDGTFKWDVNLKPIIRNLETIEVFDYELEEKQIYLGETLFISAEYSKLQVIDEKEVILKHFPNAEVFTAKGVFHCYHTEKATEFMEKNNIFY